MATIGRNQKCFCGSGRKFKKCCGYYTASEAVQSGNSQPRPIPPSGSPRIDSISRKQRQQGFAKGITSSVRGEHRLVTVGDHVYFLERSRTFHDFLFDFLWEKLGPTWCMAEQAKPYQQKHWIAKWREDLTAEIMRGARIGVTSFGRMTGAQRAYLNLAYNTYLIAHHAPCGSSNQLLETFLVRLRSTRHDDFTGKLFETYAAAAFLKAGFQLEFENESIVGFKHVEFTATYPLTGKKFSVEVKARSSTEGNAREMQEYKYLRVGSKLAKALQKDAKHARVVMIEVNIAETVTTLALDGWIGASLDQIKHLDKPDAFGRPELPSSYVFVTNHAYHNNLTAYGESAQIIATGFKIPGYGPCASFGSLADFLEMEGRHQEMFAFIGSLKVHYDVPSSFDAENLAPLYAELGLSPFLEFGEWHDVVVKGEQPVKGCLYDAVVIEEQKIAICLYRTKSGNHLTMRKPLSDAEIKALWQNPITSFGEISGAVEFARTWLELAIFFFSSYKNMPKETLLAWLGRLENTTPSRDLSQRELAIMYSEKLGRIAAHPVAESSS